LPIVNRRPLQVGVFFPHVEREMAGHTPRWRDVLDMAQTVEAMGFDSFWLPDHLLFRPPGAEPQGQWDCWSLLAAVAASTTRITIGPFVTCTSFRNPALLAKMADTVEEISGGRLILGLGAGWNEAEYSAFGYPFDHRVSRFAEAVMIITGLLRDGHVDFEGTYYQARDCELRPRGPRPQGPPIMIGTVGARMLRQTALHADAWNAFFWWTGNDPVGVPPLREAVDAACAEVGRDPGTLERTACVLVELPGATGTSFQEPPVTGSAEQIAVKLRAYAREGITHIQLRLDPNTVEGVAALAPILALLEES
jgi:alkanesulfonate monooxygenase SsuD/methylene tetrahydromethanopterin reductase-like flavin-dependent oxidoreductase (luciferase family)